MPSGIEALHLLVVDDNDQMRTIIGSVLTGAGVRDIHYAPDGRKGLQVLASKNIDVVYVDYEMPIMNGLEFLSALRSSSKPYRFTPVIMLTGHSDRYRLNAARDRGVNEFLCKPVSARSIIERLSAVIYHPRPFVECATFFGPDRRRKTLEAYEGPRRRHDDEPAVDA